MDREISQLKVNANNPRGEVVVDDSLRELAASIDAQGVLQPILITPDGTIVCGHRRVRACELVNVRMIPCVERDLTEKQQLQVMLIENLQREDLTALQTAKAYKTLTDHGLSIADISKATGFHSGSISRHLDILTLHSDLHGAFDGDRPLAIGCIPYLLKMPPQKQRSVGTVARHEGWTIARIAREANPPRPRSILREPVAPSRAPHLTPPKVSERETCPRERKAHLEYAIRAVGELLAAAPDDVFATRYKRWITIMEDDLADEEAKQDLAPTFSGAMNAFQRQPKEKTKLRVSI